MIPYRPQTVNRDVVQVLKVGRSDEAPMRTMTEPPLEPTELPITEEFVRFKLKPYVKEQTTHTHRVWPSLARR